MKIFVYMLAIAFVFMLSACGTIKETTTTTTEAKTIQGVVVHDTVTRYIAYNMAGYAWVRIDSIKRSTLEEDCHGEVAIDSAGLKAKFTYSWKGAVATLQDSIKKQTRVIETLKATVERKPIEIEATKTVKTTESTPGQLWIFWNSKQYWFSTFILGLIIGIVGMIALRMKTNLLKFIP